MALAVAALALAACGSDDAPSMEAAGNDATTSTTVASTTTVTEAGSTTPVSTEGSAAEVVRLVDVRTGTHEGHDRVTFEFEGGMPGYRIGYAERPITQDGSGDEIDVEGDAVVTVVFNPATGVRFEGEKVIDTYPRAKRRIEPGTPLLAEVVWTGDFEAYLSWAVGLRSERPFRVDELDGPPRVVIDFLA